MPESEQQSGTVEAQPVARWLTSQGVTDREQSGEHEVVQRGLPGAEQQGAPPGVVGQSLAETRVCPAVRGAYPHHGGLSRGSALCYAGGHAG